MMDNQQGTVGRVDPESETSFHEISDGRGVKNELLILMRVEQDDGRPLPVGVYTERCVATRLLQVTGVTAERITRINNYDTVIEVTADVSVVAVSQQLHQVTEWEENPVVISCIMGKKQYIIDVCRQRTAMIEQKGEADREIERIRAESREQRDTLAHLVERVNQQARMVSDLQVQSMTGSIPRIPSSLVTPQTNDHHFDRQPQKMTKTPDLPNFSGEVPTPKGEAEFDNWIFQIKSLRTTFTDDAIRNAVVSNVRGVAKTVVRALGYDAPLEEMIDRLDDRFGLGETNDALLLEFHQMVQGPHEKIQDYGSKLECKFKFLQERFPGRYGAVQLKERFFSGMNDKLRDSMRFLYNQDDCTFSKLLKNAMMAEAETKSRPVVKAKAAQAETPSTNQPNAELTSIQKQLDSMSQILKGAQFKGKGPSKNKRGSTAKAAEAQPTSRGPAITAAGPFREGRPPVQCYRCKGWGHYKRNCPNKEPVEGSVEWGNLHGEAAMEGAARPPKQEEEHPQPQQ